MVTLRAVDDQKVGAVVRAVRRKLGWRQTDVALKARVAQSAVSLLERGHLEHLSVRTIRRICAALDIRLDLVPRWRGVDLDRLLDERHAAMAEAAVRLLEREAWPSRVEVTFSSYGERGSIDVFAWREDRRAVLITEIKAELPAVEGTTRPLDVKRRLAAEIAQRELGWKPQSVGVVLVLPENSQTRRRIRAHAATFDSVLPGRYRDLRRWLDDPVGSFGGIWFLSPSGVGTAKLNSGKRVRRPKADRPSDSAGSNERRPDRTDR